jgi:hypothetical protein
LSDVDLVDKLIAENGGYATVNGQLYKVSREGNKTTYFELHPIKICQQISEGSITAAPAPAARSRDTPDPQEPAPEARLNVGDVIVVPFTTFVEARDATSGRVLFGLFEGGRWYRLESAAAARRLEFDPVTGQQLVPANATTPAGEPLVARPWDPEPYTPGQLGGPGRVSGAAVGVGGAVMVLNELLGPYASALAAQRANIAKGRAEISFWAALGGDPQAGVWDTIDRKPAETGKPGTAIFGHPLVPYVIDINAERMRPNIPLGVATYQQLQSLLAVGAQLGAIQHDGDRYFAVANLPDVKNRKRYDITEAVTQATTQVLATAEAALSAQTAGLPPEQRAGKVFRMNPGAHIFRSEQGAQIIKNSAEQMGPAPIVREISRRSSGALKYLKSGYYGTRVLVAPVNADAYRAAAFAQYTVYKNIEDVWQEVRKAGRSVNPDKLPGVFDEQLKSFVAGPGKGETTEFGQTTYTIDPTDPGHQTLATGELGSFWVSEADLTLLDEK